MENIFKNISRLLNMYVQGANHILPPNHYRCPICLGTVIKNGVRSIKKSK